MTEESEDQRTPYLGICVHLILSLVKISEIDNHQQKINRKLSALSLFSARACSCLRIELAQN
jgi:hypothetical protein